MVNRLIARIQRTSLKNKIFISTTLVILLISVPIALFTRWILITSLISELQLRGIGIANSIAESSRTEILTRDIPRLTSRLFDARLGERRLLIRYVYVLDKDGQVLAHTFTRPIPDGLTTANPLGEYHDRQIDLLRVGREAIYDVAVPVREGIYKVGSVHVGLFKKHIDQLIGKLRFTFLGFVSAMIIFCFLISLRLARYITRPIDQLTQVSDELSRGNYDVQLEVGPGMGGQVDPHGKDRVKDEVHRLASSFQNMARYIQQSQVKLQVSEEKYRSMFASGPNPIFVIDRHTLKIMDANPAAEEVYGFTRMELLGGPFTRLGPFEFKPIHAAMTANPGPTDPVAVSAKERYVKKDGTPFYVNVHACPVRYADTPALIVATTDITEMVEKDNQLIQFSKLKTLGEMSAGIAHELNQPLNAIKMGSEFLSMMLEDGQQVPREDLEDVLGEVSRQVDRASDIITRLRDFGRKSDFSREKVLLNAPVQSVLKILGRQLTVQNITVAMDLAEDSPAILAHPNRIEQVVFNLLTNARDALLQKLELHPDTDLTLTIQTLRKDGWAVINVADNGIGIPDHARKQIFEAFFTTKEMGEGMGLGLSISFGIVEDYGGKIDVASAEGVGTTFKLSFPVAG